MSVEPRKYVERRREIEAVQLTAEADWVDICIWCGGIEMDGGIGINPTPAGQHLDRWEVARLGDWIVCFTETCPPSKVFGVSYESDFAADYISLGKPTLVITAEAEEVAENVLWAQVDGISRSELARAILSAALPYLEVTP